MSDNTSAFARRRDTRRDAAGTRTALVQPHACVLALGEDWTIRAASVNCDDLLGVPTDSLLGATLADVFTEDVAHGLRARAQILSTTDPVARMERCAAPGSGQMLDVTATRVGTDVYFEFETPAPGPGFSADPEQIRRLVRRSADTGTVADAAQEAARTLSALTGFARVSVHRIGRSGLGSALGVMGLHPLSGPPGRTCLQAHADAFGPHLHVIPDVAATESVSLLAAPGADLPVWLETRGLSSAGPGEDLGHALYRDGVRAAVTIPIRIAGELWGVILCHHDSPIRPSVGDRGAMALFSHLLGYELGRLEHAMADRARSAAASLRNRTAEVLAAQPDFGSAVRDLQADIAAILPHDGWLLWYDGRFETAGHAISKAEFEVLFADLHSRAERDAVGFDRLSDIAPSVHSIEPNGTGLMVVPLSREAHEFLLMFRRLRPDDGRLHCWESWDIEAARALRGVLAEMQLELIRTGRDTRMRRQERQGLLIAELNHRMRNLLNLIQGLVTQGAGEAVSIDDYARVLEARIFAVARAHDDLTANDWGRVAMRLILERELDGVLDAKGPTVRITGDQIDLSPTAFTTMALVLHELVRNAREHGALSVRGGRVDIDMTLGEDGFARLAWLESGGPPARRPRRRGFGLKVIEDSVPYELRGTAELDFAPSGLVARFALPPGHFTRLRPAPELAAEPMKLEAAPDDIAIDGAALILDDSLIIAIESEDLLRAAGASDVHSCNSVEAALRVLDRGDVTFALLDVNLGSETSLPVAEQVWIDGIPAVLATGYGANEDLLNEFPPLPVLSKPYTVAEIKEVLRHFSQRDRG